VFVAETCYDGVGITDLIRAFAIYCRKKGKNDLPAVGLDARGWHELMLETKKRHPELAPVIGEFDYLYPECLNLSEVSMAVNHWMCHLVFPMMRRIEIPGMLFLQVELPGHPHPVIPEPVLADMFDLAENRFAFWSRP